MIEFNENEEHLLTVRKHWFVLAKQVIPLVVLAFVPAGLIIFYAWLPAQYQDVISNLLENKYGLIIGAYALWVLFLWTLAFVRLTDYYLDAWYLTDKRIVDVEQRGFFSREIAVLMLDRVQDVKINISGLLQTFFDYGDLHAQTAAQQREFIIDGAYSPYECKEKIMRVIRRYRRNMNRGKPDTAQSNIDES